MLLNQEIGTATLRNYCFIIWQALWKPAISAHKLNLHCPANCTQYDYPWSLLLLADTSWSIECFLLTIKMATVGGLWSGGGGTWWYCCHCLLLYMSRPCSGILAHCGYVLVDVTTTPNSVILCCLGYFLLLLSPPTLPTHSILHWPKLDTLFKND